MTKMAKIDTLLRRKRLKDHTLWGRTYIYSAYKGVTTRDLNIQVRYNVFRFEI